MEGEISMTQHELLDLVAQTEQRLTQDFEQRLAEALERHLRPVQARLDVVEARLPFANHHWTMAVESAGSSHPALASQGSGGCASAETGCVDRGTLSSFVDRASDVEMVEASTARRFRTEAKHRMPHPENNEYTSLSAREVPPLYERNEGPGDPDEDNNVVDNGFCDRRMSTGSGDGGNPLKEYKDLPLDTWGSGIICIIEEVPKIFSGAGGYAQYLRTGFALSCLIVNIILQYALLWFVLAYVCNPAVAKLQTLYKAYHGVCFHRDGSFVQDAWHNFPYRQSLCDMALSEPLFIGTMLILWCIRMLGEFRSVIYLITSIEAIPKVPHASLMVNLFETDSEVIHEIVGLTTRVKIIIHACITAPKLGINVCLAYIGIRWLTATVSFADLILNALVLGFIVEIDELLLMSLYPERMIRALGRAKFAAPRRAITKEEDEVDLKLRYHEAICAIFVLCSMVLAYLFIWQQVLPGFLWDVNVNKCHNIRKEKFAPQCPFMRYDEDCFPFGVNVSLAFEHKLA